MKKFLFILMMAFTVPVFANNDSTVINENERLIDKYSEKVYSAMEQLAEQLKVPAQHVYGVLVKQAVVEAWTILIVAVIGIILLSIFGPKFVKSLLKDDEVRGVLSMIISSLGLIMLTISIINLNTIVGGFLNPEYYALKEILNLIS